MIYVRGWYTEEDEDEAGPEKKSDTITLHIYKYGLITATNEASFKQIDAN